jgi:hypothetical protein
MMGYSREDWLRDQGRLPGINLDRIRFGHRTQRPKPLAIAFMGEPLPGIGRPAEKKSRPVRRDEDPGYDRFQLRLW